MTFYYILRPLFISTLKAEETAHLTMLQYNSATQSKIQERD